MDMVASVGAFFFVAMIGAVCLAPFVRIAYQRWKYRAEIAAEKFASEGNYLAAASVLEEKCRLKGPSALLLNNLATYLDAAGEHDEAVEALEEAERLFGSRYIIRLNKLLFLTHAGRTEQALFLLDQMMPMASPDNFDLI